MKLKDGTGVEKLLGNVCDFEQILGKESAFGPRESGREIRLSLLPEAPTKFSRGKKQWGKEGEYSCSERSFSEGGNHVSSGRAVCYQLCPLLYTRIGLTACLITEAQEILWDQ